MALGDVQNDSRAFGDVKQALPQLLLPQQPTTFYQNGHLSQSPADTRDQFLDAKDIQNHHYASSLPTPINGVHPSLSFHDSREYMQPQGRRMSQQSVTLTIHGLEDPASAEVRWQPNSFVTAEQRSRLERHVRKILTDVSGSDSKFNTPIRPRDHSADRSGRDSRTPDYRGPNYRFIPGIKRHADGQYSRTCSPEDEEEADYLEYVPTQSIQLGDEEAVLGYYNAVLRGIQQLALKQVLKEWIKTIEPKKQKNCPYKKGIRPKWWPQEAQYKEPDHIKVDDRILLAIGIIRHAQDPKELNGDGLSQLERVAGRQDLIFDQEPAEKQHFRKRLLDNLFTLARHEQQVKNDERDGSDQVTLPTVQKFERPDKKRKKSSDKNRSVDSDATLMGDDCKLHNGLLKPISLPSNGERGSTTPNTPLWRQHPSRDSGVCFPQTHDQTHDQHMMPYTQQYGTSGPVDSRYSSFDGSSMDSSSASPISAYPSGTAAGSAHMMYPNSTQAGSMGYEAPMQSIPTIQNHDNGMMSDMLLPSQGRPQLTPVYTTVTESDERSWQATPASYLPQQAQAFPPSGFY